MNEDLTKEEELIENEIETYVPISDERREYLETLIKNQKINNETDEIEK